MADALKMETLHSMPVESIPAGRRWMRTAIHLPAPLWMLMDLLIAGGVTLYTLRAHPVTLFKFRDEGTLVMAIAAAVVFVMAGTAANIYGRENLREWIGALARATACSFVAVMAMLAVAYLYYFDVPGRWVSAGLIAYLIGATTLLRLPFLLFRSRLKTRFLFIGNRSEVNYLKDLLDNAGEHSFSLVGYYYSEELLADTESAKTLNDACERLNVDEIILSSSRDEVGRLFDLALIGVRHGCRLRVLQDLVEDETHEVPLDLIDSAWLLGGGWDLRNHLAEVLKRAGDITLGLTGLILCSPVIVFLAILIKLTSKGPVFYTQTRVGRFGVPFQIYKFRTMRVDAEKNGAQWAGVKDPRVTWYGGILRKSRLDETPQFVNIVLGHMSFVGPRPERPEFVDKLDKQIPFYACRHLVRPGLTGWAQIWYGYGATVEEARRKLQFDLYYVRHLSVRLDIYIVLRTIVVIARGAR